jgi:hypothetical protein
MMLEKRYSISIVSKIGACMTPKDLPLSAHGADNRTRVMLPETGELYNFFMKKYIINSFIGLNKKMKFKKSDQR